MIEAVAKYTGQDFSGIKDLDEARKMADAINVPYEKILASVKSTNPSFEDTEKDLLLITTPNPTNRPEIRFAAFSWKKKNTKLINTTPSTQD